MSEELIGYVSVDSGMIMVSDPCRTVLNTRENERRAFGKDWGKLIERIGDADVLQITDALKQESGWENIALLIGGFGGDGVYPVYVRRQTDQRGRTLISEILIRFKPDGGKS